MNRNQKFKELLESFKDASLIRGVNNNKPGYCYYIKIRKRSDPNFVAYKLGMTTNSVERRIGNFIYKNKDLIIVILAIYTNLDAHKVASYEKALHDDVKKRYPDSPYTGEDLLVTGNSECYTYDVLKLDV